MARVFNANADGFRAIAVGPEVRSAMAEIAEKGKEIAEGLAQDFRVSGEYADSFSVGDATVMVAGKYPGPRAAAVLQNSAPYAIAVEYGYEGRWDEKSSSAHRVLGRTLDTLETTT